MPMPNQARKPELPWDRLAPEVFYANHLYCTPGFTFGPRIIGDYQFIYVASGKGEAFIQQQRYEAQKGDLFYYGPGIAHTFIADQDDPFVVYGVHFNWEAEGLKQDYWAKIIDLRPDMDVPYADNRFTVGPSAIPAQSLLLGDKRHLPWEQFEPRFARLATAFSADQPYTAVLLSAAFVDLVVAIKQAEQSFQQPHSVGSSVVQRVARQLEEHACEYYDRSWLEQWTAYHPDYVSRLFRRQAGLTPYAFFMNCKLDKAKQLLMQTDDSLLSIAEQINAGSIHAFSKWFKQSTGYPPGKYRSRSRLI